MVIISIVSILDLYVDAIPGLLNHSQASDCPHVNKNEYGGWHSDICCAGIDMQ